MEACLLETLIDGVEGCDVDIEVVFENVDLIVKGS